MALIPTISVCLDSACDTITITETTGIYDASSNVGGYGAPNIATSDIDSAVLTIISPSEQTYTINLFDNSFPSSNTSYSYEIPMSELGNRTSIEDGYWQITYTLVDGGTTYTANGSKVFFCNAKCCVARLLAAIEPDECDCNEQNIKRIENYTKARTFLSSLENAANCFNIDRFDTIKAILDKLCRNTSCKTCN
jgi:hypothetical protein